MPKGEHYDKEDCRPSWGRITRPETAEAGLSVLKAVAENKF